MNNNNVFLGVLFVTAILGGPVGHAFVVVALIVLGCCWLAGAPGRARAAKEKHDRECAAIGRQNDRWEEEKARTARYREHAIKRSAK